MKQRHAVVGIGWWAGKGIRKVLSRHRTREEAVAQVLVTPFRSLTPIYRDGTTGQRFSYRECEELQAANSQQ